MSFENDKEHIEVHTPIDSEDIEPILENPTPGHVPVLRQLGVALFLLLFVFGTTYAGKLAALIVPHKDKADLIVSTKLADETTSSSVENPFNDTSVEAQAAFVWDVRSQKILFNKNADKVLPLASITKLMTALVAYELLDDNATVNISLDAIKTDGDSGLTDGESFTLKDLTDMVLIASSNDGAAALGAAAGAAIGGKASPDDLFIEAMNLRAKELGLTNTTFKNMTGLDISPTQAGAYSSARDIALLMEYIITTYPDVTSLTTAAETRVFNEKGEYHEVENTNEIVNQINGLIASKTGYTELAGGNLAVAFEAGLNHPVIVVVLGSTFNGRFSDVLTLSEKARVYVSAETIQ